jgi:hypothetical protein
MLSRSPSSAVSLSVRAAAQRRLRRTSANHRLYCSTNGCATFLVPDGSGTMATCPICGSHRRLSVSGAPSPLPH